MFLEDRGLAIQTCPWVVSVWPLWSTCYHWCFHLHPCDSFYEHYLSHTLSKPSPTSSSGRQATQRPLRPPSCGHQNEHTHWKPRETPLLPVVCFSPRTRCWLLFPRGLLRSIQKDITRTSRAWLQHRQPAPNTSHFFQPATALVSITSTHHQHHQPMTATPRDTELSKRRVWDLKDHADTREGEPFHKGYTPGVPIAIDFGSSSLRAGLATGASPVLDFPTLISRYRDRKTQKAMTFVGNDVFLDPSIKAQAKTPYDGPLINNWDYVEQILDYTFAHVGVSSQGAVDNPIVITERPATTVLQRKGFYELLYESYGVNKVAMGIDSLFSYYQNNGTSGLVIGTGHESTHMIPVIAGKAIMTEAKRLNWGGRHASGYMANLLSLKYPYFPTKITNYQVDNIVKDFCYVSKDYDEELKSFLSLEVLEEKDITLEAPFTEVEKQQKTEEELARQAEKRKESGRRLQEQAQQKRLEKLVQKEQEFEYYTKLKERLATLNKKQQLSTIKEEGFEDEVGLNKYVSNLEKSLKRARKQDVGDEDAEEAEEPTFPLVEIPDDQLDEEQIKEKRKQRLMKANYDARQRAKKEKEEEKARLEEEARKDEEWRATDLQGWIHDRREKLKQITQKRKERLKLKEQLNDRKSLAAQMRMKSIASLAADEKSGSKRKRNGASIDNDPNDTFGANDDDWAIYRDLASVDDEEVIEEEDQLILKLEKELLDHDPNFTVEDTLEAQYDWRNSVLHLFLRGPRPYNSEDVHEQHQVHVNVERIRVPEVLFQPSIAGVDQAGIPELGENMLLHRLQGGGFSGDSYDALQDIFVTGGQALFQNFEERLHSEFRKFLPHQSPLQVRLAKDPLLDAWRGMAKWAQTPQSQNMYLTRAEYLEMGPEYVKEHGLGNLSLV